MRILPALTFAAALMGAAFVSTANACVTVTPVSPGVVSYDPTSPYPYKERLKLAVRASAGCGQGSDARIGDIAIGFARRPSQSLDFEIIGSDGNLLSPSATAATLQTFSFPDAGSTIIEFDLRIGRGQAVSSGELAFDIVYRSAEQGCVDAACGSAFAETVPVVLAVDPVKTFSLSLAGAARGSIDFGTLTSGQTRSLSLSATATAPYQIVFETENGQKLLLEGGSAARPEDNVAYTMTLNGNPVSEDLPYSERALFGTGGVVSIADLAFTIASAEGKRAGKYRDTVTITITPLMGAGISAPAS